MARLTPKQEQFVREYLIDLNATQAAIRAGYSPKTAEKIGSENLKKPDVAEAIKAAMTERSAETGINATRVISEIAAMALYDPADIMIDGEPGEEDALETIVNGRVIYGLRNPADIKRLPENMRRAIVGWSWDRNGNFTVKLADKAKALDQLMRHLGEYRDRLEVSNLDNLAERLDRAKRLEFAEARLPTTGRPTLPAP